MHIRQLLGLTFCLALGARASLLPAQVMPAAAQQSPPFTVGVGASVFSPDYNSGVMLGVTFWADYKPHILSHFTPGLSLTGQLRDLNYHRSASQTNLREDTYTVGFKYQWEKYENIRPYGRFMAGLGTIKFPTSSSYDHDSRTITTYSGGADTRLRQNLWLRVDYEYQYWPSIFSRNLHPQGVTVGVVYDFGGRTPRQ